MNHDIYHLRHVSLDPKLALQLSPFISAYRPHDPIPTKDELGEKVIPVESEFSMKNLCKDIGKEYKPKKKT